MRAFAIGLSLSTWLCPLFGQEAEPGQPANAPAAVDFVREVAPILHLRCVDCHGPKKQKGDLRLDRREHAFAGEAAEWSVQPGAPDQSELLRRVLLPADDEDVMPNEGGRLTDAQIATLRAWIATGADWPAAGDAFFVAQEERAKVPRFEFGIAAPAAEVQARIDAALQQLTARGVVAARVAADTPAVDVNASPLGAAFTDADLPLLAELGPVLVWLNLARTAVTDAGMAQLAALPELRRLSVARTAVGDAGLAALGVLPKLAVLNVHGSKVGDAGLRSAAAWPVLAKVYAFDAAVTAAGAAAVLVTRPQLEVDRGDYAAERAAAAAAAIAAARPVNATCPCDGEPIAADQVVDHDGLRIAFCGAKCKAAFAAAPANYAAKVAEYRAAAGAAETKPDAGKPNAGEPGKAGGGGQR